MSVPNPAPTGSTVPYWRLSGFYFFYFASLGALIPYWSLYLKDLDYSARDIGVMMGLVMATKIISPNVWGWIADHTGRSMLIVRIGCLLAMIAFTGVFLDDSYWWLVLVMLAFSFFWNAALPQFEATTLNHLGPHSHRYSGIRLWGSIGFIVTVAALGPLLDVQGAAILPVIVLALFACIWLSSLMVPEQATGYLHLERESLLKVLLKPQVAALLLVCFLMQASHGPYYTFYTIYMEGHGYSRSVIGQLWALGVIAEVGVFLLMHRWVLRFGLRTLLLASLVLTVLRWILIGQFVESTVVMVFAQILHAASFGVYHGSAIQLVHRYFTGRHQGRGQALYSSVSFGAGGAVGSLLSGMGWDVIGPGAVYLGAAASALLATVVAWVWIHPAREKQPS